MTSIMHPEYYYDTVVLDHQEFHNIEFTTEHDPLSLVIQIVFNRDARSYWNRGYKAQWKIAWNKLYLVSLSGSVNGHSLSMQSLFENIIEKRADNMILADWYSGEIKIEKESIIKEINGTEFDCITYRHYQVSKGKVLSYNDSYEEIKTNNLSF